MAYTFRILTIMEKQNQRLSIKNVSTFNTDIIHYDHTINQCPP